MLIQLIQLKYAWKIKKLLENQFKDIKINDKH